MKSLDYLALPCKLQHEDMEDSEAQRLRGSTGLLLLRVFSSSFSSSISRKPLDRPGEEPGKRLKKQSQRNGTLFLSNSCSTKK